MYEVSSIKYIIYIYEVYNMYHVSLQRTVLMHHTNNEITWETNNKNAPVSFKIFHE